MEKIKQDLKHLYDEIDARLEYYINDSWELSEFDQMELTKLLKFEKALKEVLK